MMDTTLGLICLALLLVYFLWPWLQEAFKEEAQPDKSQKSVEAQPEEPSQTESLDEILLAREQETIKLAREVPSRERYKAYLKTTHWQKKRQEALVFYGSKCTWCGRTGRLQVHHNSYENLGMEDVSRDLVVLCDKCHGIVHHGVGGRIIMAWVDKMRGRAKMPGTLKKPLETGLERVYPALSKGQLRAALRGFRKLMVDRPDLVELKPPTAEAILEAVKEGDMASVSDYIDFGADVNAKDKDGWTVLMWATLRGHVPTMQALLGKGADVNARSRKNDTALKVAIWKGYTEIAQLLKDAGARE